ncbi:MAG TPA: TonB-dependent receptor [Gemmatimonadaceae bacterium]|nr:TonB-dependent receptor [Gemmatimonadaceae bacterium]
MILPRSMSGRLLASLVALSLLLLPRLAQGQAQATTGVIRGLVTDDRSAPLAGALVTLRNQETNVTRSVRTSDRGVYAAPLLPLGRYEVTVRAIGFAAASRRDLVLRVGQALDIPFRVSRQAVELAAVRVNDRANAAVSTTRSEFTTPLSEEVVKGLPNNGRNFLALTALTPNVATTQGPDGDVISIAGQRGTYNNVSVDGADFNNPFFGEQRGGQRPAFTFNLDAVQELVVTNAGANAEFGRSAGGFVNVITKSGTNTMRGTVHYYGKNGALSGNLRGNGASLDPDFSQNQFGFTLGGPIIKDRLFFFTAYDQQVYRETKQQSRPASAALDSLQTFLTTAFGGALASDFRPIDRTNDGQVFLLKLDYRVNATNNFSLKYNFTNSRQVNGTFDVDSWGASANAIEKDYSHAVSGQLTSQLTNSVANEFRFQFAREDRPRDYDAPTLPGGRDFPDTGMDFANGFRIGRPFFIPVEYNDTRVQLLDNVTWARGNHLFKVGGEVNAVKSNQTFIGFANGRFIFSSVTGFINYVNRGRNYVECSNGSANVTGACPTGSTITGPVQLYLQQAGVGGRTVEESGTQSLAQTDLGVFIQDTWTPRSNLTINYGLRWEAQQQPDPLTDPADVFYAPLIGASRTTPAGTFRFPSNGKIPSDYGMFQPRFGLAWDVNGDGKSVLRVSAGQYFARIAALNLASVRNNNGSVGQTIFRNSALTGVLGAPPAYDQLLPAPTGAPFRPDIFVIDENFRNPRTRSVTAGYEREVVSGISASVNYVYAKADRLTRFVNRNDVVFGDGTNGPFTAALAGGNGIGTLTTVESTARSEYNGVTFGIARRNARNNSFEVNYTLASDKSDDDNERDPFTFRYARANRLDREWSYSDRDQRHRLNAYLLSRLPAGFAINNRFSYASAQPVSESCGANNAGTGQRGAAASRVCPNGTILDRNTLRRDNDFASWDVRLSRPFTVRGSQTIEASIDVFNVLGRNNFKDPAFNGLLFNFDGTVRSGLGDPRQVQAGLRYQF